VITVSSDESNSEEASTPEANTTDFYFYFKTNFSNTIHHYLVPSKSKNQKKKQKRKIKLNSNTEATSIIQNAFN
jgi:hypothetical protein